jgi:MYXO-CTERM domain-containing protein
MRLHRPARLASALVPAVLLAATVTDLRADEGQWTPQQVAQGDPRDLAALGLSIPIPTLVNDNDGGLVAAAVQLAGCSAAFVSAQGLIVTNYHCVIADVQAHSTPARDLLKSGFVAKTLGEELPVKSGATVRIPLSSRDVTAEVLAAAVEATSDLERYHAIEKKKREIVAACEKREAQLRCDVAAFQDGAEHLLIERRELRDLRLVYVPPGDLGEYGGEIDNWMWPRHTADVALLRAYDANPGEGQGDSKPFRPKRFLRVSPDGVERGSFVALLGYPAQTMRHLPYRELVRWQEQVLPSREQLFGEFTALLEAQGQRSSEVAIKVKSLAKSFANREKHAAGMREGLARLGLVDTRKKRDEALRAWVKSSEGGAHAQLLTDLDQLTAQNRKAYPRELVLDTLMRGASLVPFAVELVRKAREGEKPDAERAPPFMDRNAVTLEATQKRRLRTFDVDVEVHLLAALIERAKRLEQPIPAFARLDELAGTSGEPLLDLLRERIAGSKLAETAAAERLLQPGDEAQDASSFEALEDPVMDLALELVPTLEEVEREQHEREGLSWGIAPRHLALLRERGLAPTYPDANGTLRVSFAKLQGYSPRDGLWAWPRTTLAGQVDKHLGEAPFRLPDTVRRLALEARDSYWADPQVGDVPVCFLSDADTSGGNSGSAVINARGELVGINFDRVWENVAGDFGYSPQRSRSIVLDVRYLLWLLDRVEDAGTILAELGVASYRDAPRRPRREAPLRPPAREPIGCALATPPPTSGPLVIVALVTALAWRRRREM